MRWIKEGVNRYRLDDKRLTAVVWRENGRWRAIIHGWKTWYGLATCAIASKLVDNYLRKYGWMM